MPVCLKCGKEIEEGEKYCEDCRGVGQEQVESLVNLVASGKYRGGRPSGRKWLVISLLALCLILVGIAMAFIFSLPSGPGTEGNLQSAACRNNLEEIDRAIQRYYQENGEYPPTGPVDEKHPLVFDLYLDEAPRCPATDHLYLIKAKDFRVVVECDSGLENHSLDQDLREVSPETP